MKYQILTMFILITYFSSVFPATTYYVSNTGNDSNNGTSATTPFKTVTKACSLSSLTAGDKIILRGGTYVNTTTISLSKSGANNAPIRLEAYPEERVLMDFSGVSSGKRGLSLTGSYWYIKGIDVYKAADNGMIITGAYNTIEYCSFFENGDSGLQLSGGAHDNKIVNCDSYWNADPSDYGDADGFACKMDVGTNNYFFGCRSWMNVDDGWDGYLRGADDVSTVVENCWTWRNGYFKDGTDAGANANGNGFKMGGSDDKLLKHNFTLKNCIAFDNKSKGFDQNNNKGNMVLYNCTGYRNVGNDFSISSTLPTGKTCVVINCVDVSNSKVALGSFVSQSTNSWMSPFSVTTSDFLSLDSLGVTAKRNSDGSLPKLNFLHLKVGSDLIDAGTNVGLPYAGSAPDLGAYELEPVTGVVELKSKYKNPYFNGSQLVMPVETLPMTCSVYDLQGRMLLHCSNVQPASSLECGFLQHGLYMVELFDGFSNLRFKLLKES